MSDAAPHGGGNGLSNERVLARRQQKDQNFVVGKSIRACGVGISLERNKKIQKVRNDVERAIQRLEDLGCSAAMLVLDDSAAAYNGSLHVVKARSRLANVINDDDFPSFVDDCLTQCTPEGALIASSGNPNTIPPEDTMLETIREKLKNLKGLIVADPAKMLNHRNMCYGDDDLCLTLWPNTKLPNAIWFNRGGMEKSVVALKKYRPPDQSEDEAAITLLVRPYSVAQTVKKITIPYDRFGTVPWSKSKPLSHMNAAELVVLYVTIKAYCSDRESGAAIAQPAKPQVPLAITPSEHLWDEESLRDTLNEASETRWFQRNSSQTQIVRALLTIRPTESWSKLQLKEDPNFSGTAVGTEKAQNILDVLQKSKKSFCGTPAAVSGALDVTTPTNPRKRKQMSPFIAFKCSVNSELKAKNPTFDGAQLQSLAGQMWRAMTEEEKENEKARQNAESHDALPNIDTVPIVSVGGVEEASDLEAQLRD